MDPLSQYQKSYKNKALNRAYRKFIDGRGSTKELAKSAGMPSLRTLEKYSALDGWVSERDNRKAHLQQMERNAVEVAALAAAATSEREITAKIEAGADHKTVMMAVLKRHQKFWDRVESRVEEVLAEVEREAATKAKPIQLGRLIPILKAAEIASANVRKAYGIPDVSKIEWEDTTPAAKRHADTIRERRMKRALAESRRDAGGEAPLPN